MDQSTGLWEEEEGPVLFKPRNALADNIATLARTREERSDARHKPQVFDLSDWIRYEIFGAGVRAPLTPRRGKGQRAQRAGAGKE